MVRATGDRLERGRAIGRGLVRGSRRGDEGSTILFAMAEPVRRSLTIASGHACTESFETFCLDDLR